MTAHHPDWDACLRLRYQYFVEARGWAAPNPENPFRESDAYDPYCHHLAIFEQERVVAYLRVLPATAPSGLMLDHEFSCLIPSHYGCHLQRSESVELSRLAVSPRVTNLKTISVIVEQLLRFLYHLSLTRGYQNFYIVTEMSWLRAFTRRFHLPFRRIGITHTFPDGTPTVAAVATREELEQSMRKCDPAKFAWYSDATGLPLHLPEQ